MEPPQKPATHPPSRVAGAFWALWAGHAISLFGSMLVQFALVWWIAQTTDSAMALSIATLLALLPGVLLGPAIGALVDRWDRRAIMLASDGGMASLTLGLALLAAIGTLDLGPVYAVMFLRSLLETFHWSALQASIPLMIPERHLARIAGLNQALSGALNMIAPPAGAILLHLLPLPGVLMVDVLTALLAMLTLLFITIPRPSQAAIRPAWWKEMLDGLDYARRWSGALVLMGMGALINFAVTPAFALLPLMVTRHFRGGALELAWLESAWGIGIISGGLALGAWGGFRRRIYTTLAGLIGMGCALLTMGLLPPNAFLIAVGAMFVGGAMNVMTNGPIFAILQAVVPPELQGRVLLVIGSVVGIIAPLGMALAGPVADAVGVQVWFIAGGLTCALTGLMALGIPSVVQLEEQAPSRVLQ
ncbi:MAG: MFS transporter [Thermoflexus sp.]|uniref:MFS transporter n=1 Tax=Thermoflexus sp. TaxID=1969742 RepID=UPI0025FB9932|nr:MFS transporter [Thermoflexus sp.]MCS6962667.1 MFS transporter [Thermoflexus sp.]